MGMGNKETISLTDLPAPTIVNYLTYHVLEALGAGDLHKTDASPPYTLGHQCVEMSGRGHAAHHHSESEEWGSRKTAPWEGHLREAFVG